MHLVLTDNDAKSVLGDYAARRALRGAEAEFLGQEEQQVLDAVPKMIAARVRKMLPEGFVVQSISIKCQLSGMVMGVGVSGEAEIVFGSDEAAEELNSPR